MGSDWRPGGSKAPRQSVCPVGREGPRQSRGSRCLRAGAAMGHCDDMLTLLSGRRALALQPVSPEHAHPPVGVGGPEGSQHPCLSAPPSPIHALTRRCPQPTSVAGRIPGILPGLGWEACPPGAGCRLQLGWACPPGRELPSPSAQLRAASVSCASPVPAVCADPVGSCVCTCSRQGAFWGLLHPRWGLWASQGWRGTVPTQAELGFPSMCTAGPTATRESGILCLCLIHTRAHAHTHMLTYTHTC